MYSGNDAWWAWPLHMRWIPNPWIFYIFKDCLHCALIRNDQNPWAFLHQGRLITHLGETSDFFLCDLPLWILVILQNQFIESDSQLCKTKYAWKRNLTSVYLQSVGLQVIFILFKAFSINFYNKRIVFMFRKSWAMKSVHKILYLPSV